jgi:Xaa-Pro aminopeptidase
MMGDRSIAILPSASTKIRNRDVEHSFRQDSDFLYLTGFDEPEAVLVLIPERKNGEFVLFCRERDPKMELWHGKRFGLEGACEIVGADDAFPIGDMDEILPGLLEGHEKVYYTMGKDAAFDSQVVNWVNKIRDQKCSNCHVPSEFIALDFYLHEMRLFKSKSEIVLMRKAAKISSIAHHKAMQVCKAGKFEYHLEAEIVYEFNKKGSETAYPCIVGSGENGCILHYTENDQELSNGDLVLIDAGVEIEGYASDISRTFPVSGKFSDAQKELYQIVLDAQYAGIEKTKIGHHWNEPHEAVIEVITKGLVKLGLLKGHVKELIKDGDYKRFYMHRTGHWLGLDVHDVGDYKIDREWREIEVGMVMTVEPGLYVNNDDDIPEKYRNIGIRIEDDILVTKAGNDVLSKDAVKTIADVEKMMAS